MSSVNDNFYLYVNKSWLDETVIPEDQQRWSVFNELNEQNTDRLKQLLDKLQNNEDSEIKKMFILYNSYRNRPNNFNNNELVSFLEKINNINTKIDLLYFIWENFTQYELSTPLNINIFSDFNNADKNIIHLGGGGIGLPDRDYYFKDEHTEIRTKYKDFMKRYLSLLGLFDIDSIYYIEEQLASKMYTNVESRNIDLKNNMSNIDIIEKCYPHLHIREMLDFLGIEPQEINILNPTYLSHFNDLWNTITIRVWKQYFIYLYFRKIGSYLSLETERLLFDFYGTELSGVKEMKPLWKRSIMFLEDMVGMILSKAYVKLYFSEDKKNKVNEMIEYIKNALVDSINTNTWMSQETKNKALEKLKKMSFKTGYPDKWMSYENLNVSENNSLLENVLQVLNFNHNFELEQLYKSIDRTLWFMNPHEINAYYSPSYNEMVFPAGILQEPFFYEDDMIKSFGGIGMVIGHEITHGFDDQGRKYDGNGNLNEWWGVNDLKRFNEESNKLKEQFNRLTIEGNNVNGELTLGENLADIGGIVLSYNAMMEWDKKMNHNQSDYKDFFYNYANIWKCKARKEDSLRRLITDPHSPPCHRVNQILMNFDPFYYHFKINKSDNMYLEPEDRIKIW